MAHSTDTSYAAKRVFIAYRQLDGLLGQISEKILHTGVQAVLQRESYDRIFFSLKECFRIDSDFAEMIEHLKPIPDTTNPFEIHAHIHADGPVLRGAAHAFIELYLSSEDKRKTIGFNP